MGMKTNDLFGCIVSMAFREYGRMVGTKADMSEFSALHTKKKSVRNRMKR